MGDLKGCCSSAEPEPIVQASGACCGHTPAKAVIEDSTDDHCCAPDKQRIDWLLWGSLSAVALGYLVHAMGVAPTTGWLHTAAHSAYELINTMWLGVVIAIAFVGLLSQIPQALVMSVLGRGGSFQGIIRATLAGVLMDLCSHGILMVAMKLYQKGASLGQTMAFLVASPWNSLSLTLILITLIGWQWTLSFIVLSMALAIVTGLIFDRLAASNSLPANPNAFAGDQSTQSFGQLFDDHWRRIRWRRELAVNIVREGVSGARIVLRWLLFGVVLASLIRAFVPADLFQQWLGPTALGLAVTLVAATIIEVCSEGSAPIAADIMNRTGAPGNGFAFLMTGVATDYTEIMVLKDTMQSWKVALFLPLITVPQVIVVALILNQLG